MRTETELSPTVGQRSRFVLFQLTRRDLFILLDRTRAPNVGDLVIINYGENPKLARYSGESKYLGVATILRSYDYHPATYT